MYVYIYIYGILKQLYNGIKEVGVPVNFDPSIHLYNIQWCE